MALELNKLTGQVEAMGLTLARRQRDHAGRVREARAALAHHARVTDELRQKIGRAGREDTSWRGADPVGDRLDERHEPTITPLPATLIAVDGSQIYPDRHGIAPYYLLNTAGIVLRQGTGEAPTTNSQPTLFFEDGDLYDEKGRPRNVEHINYQRDCREIEMLADLAETERSALGGDLSRPIVALMDGPLLFWTPQRMGDRENRRQIHGDIKHFTWQLERLRRARAVPIGYVDRPNSANVLRTLELADLTPEDITREKVRTGPYRLMADRLLFADLEPNQRSGLFASTSELNDHYAQAGHRIAFLYVNMARRSGDDNAIIARVELPEWAVVDREMLDLTQTAIYADCDLTGLPYVLVRAHELAVVSSAERGEVERMLGQVMIRNGLSPLPSAKARQKLLTGNKSGRRSR